MTSHRILTKEEKQPRHELKYNISYGESLILSSRLKKLFRTDRHSDSHGCYRVSSLYFDTPYDRALKEKLDGVRNREKFRIRYYNDDTSFIRLEKKIKKTGLCCKYSAPLTKQEVMDIIEGKIDFLIDSDNPLLTEFYSKLKGQLLMPAKVVTYIRQAYIYEPGNVRITIDSDLSSDGDFKNFLSGEKISLDMSQGVAVLEVKYDRFLPDMAAMAVADIGRLAQAYSKYAQSRIYE